MKIRAMTSADEVHQYLWRTLHSNGWRWVNNLKDNTEEALYTMTFLERYDCKITAHIADRERGLDIDGCYGVLWLDVDYEYDHLSWSEIEEMQQAILDAEDNLLLIGIPFTELYTFHGKNAVNKKRRNDSIRRRLDLNTREEIDAENE